MYYMYMYLNHFIVWLHVQFSLLVINDDNGAIISLSCELNTFLTQL